MLLTKMLFHRVTTCSLTELCCELISMHYPMTDMKRVLPQELYCLCEVFYIERVEQQEQQLERVKKREKIAAILSTPTTKDKCVLC